MNTKKLESSGPFKALFSQGKDSSKPKLVMFHGYGADAYDLYALAQHIDPKENYNWVFPNGPLEVPIGPGFFGRAWFPIDMSAHEEAACEGRGVDYSKKRPPGVDKVASKALEFLKEINFQPSEHILGGFSQGSMMCVAVEILKDLRSSSSSSTHSSLPPSESM